MKAFAPKCTSISCGTRVLRDSINEQCSMKISLKNKLAFISEQNTIMSKNPFFNLRFLLSFRARSKVERT